MCDRLNKTKTEMVFLGKLQPNENNCVVQKFEAN